MVMPGRSFTIENYRYAFNGMEKDDEIKGTGNSLDFGARIYDNRIGRWMSPDPLFSSYPWQSPYTGMDNNPINRVDLSGMAASDPLKILPPHHQKIKVTTYQQIQINEYAKKSALSIFAKELNKLYPEQEIPIDLLKETVDITLFGVTEEITVMGTDGRLYNATLWVPKGAIISPVVSRGPVKQKFRDRYTDNDFYMDMTSEAIDSGLEDIFEGAHHTFWEQAHFVLKDKVGVVTVMRLG